MPVDLRRQHRIIYQTKIRMRSPGRDVSVVARVQNLSARGMFITATDLPAAGAEVQCRLTLGGEGRTLRGRVAWVRPASPAAPLKSPGAGIEFLDLDQQISELLCRLVEPDDDRREAVDVWFEGMAAPIRCHAVVVGEGLRIETRLPFMRLSSMVRVAFTQQTPPSAREGIVDGVSLVPNQSDGVPFLRVAVTLPPLDSAQGTIEARARRNAGTADRAASLGSTLVDPGVSRAPNGRETRDVPVVTSKRDRSETTQRIAVSEILPPEEAPSPAGTPRERPTWLPGWVPVGLQAPAGVKNIVEKATPAWRTVSGVVKRGGRLSYLLAGIAVGAILVSAFTSRESAAPPESVVANGAPTTTEATTKTATKADTKADTTKAAIVKAPTAKAPTPPGEPSRGAATAQFSTPVGAAAAEGTGDQAERAGPDIEQLAPQGATGSDAKIGGVSVVESGRSVMLTVPLEGNTGRVFTREIHYNDRGLLGLALLRARPINAVGVGVVKPAGSPAKVLIRRRGAGSLVRFAFDPRKYQGKLSQEGSHLLLTLTRR